MSLVKGNNLVLPLGCNQMLILKRTLHVLTDVLSQVSVHSSFISSVIKVFTSFSTPVFFIFLNTDGKTIISVVMTQHGKRNTTHNNFY